MPLPSRCRDANMTKTWTHPRRPVRIGNNSHVLFVSLTGIGNLLMLTPVLSLLKSVFPHIRIAVLVLGSTKDVLMHNPDIDEVIIYPSKQNILLRLKFLWGLRKNGYDACFYAYPNVGIMSAILLSLLTPGLTVNFEYPFLFLRRCGLFNSVSVPVNPGMHDIEKNLSLLRVCGLASHRSRLVMRLEISSAERRAAKRFLKDRNRKTPLIGFHIGARERAKVWPLENFSAVIDMLLERTSATILIVGGPREAEVLGSFPSSSRDRVIIAAGKTSLLETAALIQECNLFVTNDSGPMHMAVAVGTKVVSVFLSSDVRRTSPYGSQHIVFSLRKKEYQDDRNRNHFYVDIITPELVGQKIVALLKNRPS